MSFDDGFTVVTGRRKRSIPSRSLAVPTSVHNLQGQENIDINPVLVLRKVEDSKKILYASEFLRQALSILDSDLSRSNTLVQLDIVCYGLGHFTECNIARYQLAFLLILQNKFKAFVFVHDPVFYACEVDILRNLDFNIIQENEEGKRPIKPGKVTILYCPHSPKQLINNFLWQNWGRHLKDCIIIGNSFTDVIERNISSDFLSFSFIKKIQPYTDEQTIENNFEFTDVFNNTSIHIFREDKLDCLEPEFWSNDCIEPVYPVNDTEFVRRQT